MSNDWPYYDLNPNDGRIYRRQGQRHVLAFPRAPRFGHPEQAETWLWDHNLRGSVRSVAHWPEQRLARAS